MTITENGITITEENKFGLDALIVSLMIFKRYADPKNRTSTVCSHDTLWMDAGIKYEDIVGEDKEKLHFLGWDKDEYDEGWSSTRFGS